jgi:CspA family cold shock protein
MSERKSGIVKWFNNKKGFGFIEQEGGEDIFAHYKSIRGDGFRTLNQGERVEFVIIDGPKGLQADDITLLE